MSTTGLSSAVGTRSTQYYTRLFNQYEGAAGAWKPSWNWAAFVCSTGWFFFRRMFLFGAINLAVLLLVLLPRTVHLTSFETTIANAALGVYVVMAFGVLPVVADWLYYRHLKNRLDATSNAEGKTAPNLLSFGVAAGGTTLAATALIYAAIIGSAPDYAVRVHVVDALLAVAPLKTAVENVAKQKGALPATAAELPAVGAARLHPGIKLADLAPGGVVRVVFTGFRHIEARSVEIVPTLNDKTIEWRCYNVDMPEKELPAQCRVTRARPVVPPVPAIPAAPAKAG